MDERVIALEGNGSRPSHRGGGYRDDGMMFTLNTVDKHSVCYEKPSEVLIFKERAGKPGGGKGLLVGKDVSFTLSTLRDETICYAVENHPADSRVKIKDDGISETLTSRCGTGG